MLKNSPWKGCPAIRFLLKHVKFDAETLREIEVEKQIYTCPVSFNLK
jgi:hypothetical protein